MRNNDEIIDILNKLKEEKGLSLSELARRVNMAKSALSRYFNKTRQEVVYKFAERQLQEQNKKPKYIIS